MNRSIAIKEEVYQVLKERARKNYRGIASQLEFEVMKTNEPEKHLREYVAILSDEPDGYVKISIIYHHLKRILGDE